MGTFLRESNTLEQRARIWVIPVAKAMCQVVKNRAGIHHVRITRFSCAGRPVWLELLTEIWLALLVPFSGVGERLIRGKKRHTKVRGCKNPLVEQNDGRTHGNPQAGRSLVSTRDCLNSHGKELLRDEERRVHAAAGGRRSGDTTLLELPLILSGLVLGDGRHVGS